MSGEGARKKTWWICGFLFLATVLSYLDRQVLSLTAEKVIAEFGLSKETFGHVISAFRYAYGVMQITGGWIVDRHGPQIVYPAALGVWSLAGMLMIVAQSARMLSAFRFMLGIGEAFNWPCALKVTHHLLTPRDRPLANGIFNSGAAAGAMLAPVIVTFTTLYFGWRAAFVITGAFGGLWIAGWLWYTRDWAGQPAAVNFPLQDVLRVMGRILTKQSFWMLAVTAVIVNSVSYFLADWVPLYLKTERGFSFAAGNAISIIVYGGLEAGNIVVGLLVRKLVTLGLALVTALRFALLVRCRF